MTPGPLLHVLSDAATARPELVEFLKSEMESAS